jgi:hypothetical protein
MLGLPLAFSAPLVLAALALLPVLYVLLRITPPRPQQIAFPPLRLILDLRAQEETPARTPWWLLLLRLALAAFIILAMAGPIWNPPPASEGQRGTLFIIMDDGWPAAPSWAQRVASVTERVQAAARDGRTIALLPLSEGGRDVLKVEATRALERLRALKPVPHLPDRMQALPAVQRFLLTNADTEVVWIADDLENGQGRAFATALVEAGKNHKLQVVLQDRPALAVAGAENGAGSLDVRVLRARANGTSQGSLRALDLKGLPIGETRGLKLPTNIPLAL